MRIKSNHLNQQQCSSTNVTFWVGEDECLATDAEILSLLYVFGGRCDSMNQDKKARGVSKIYDSWCGMGTGAGWDSAPVCFDRNPALQIHLV